MRIFSAFVLTLFLAFTHVLQAQVLPGSTCATALPVECGAVYATNTQGVPNDNATSGASACYGVGNAGQIWYSYTATENGMLMLTSGEHEHSIFSGSVRIPNLPCITHAVACRRTRSCVVI
ncbi:MAG: hypothetical protein ACKOSR_01280, partial [Flavobacteriales bacterium]